jgi:hypothetical protein
MAVVDIRSLLLTVLDNEENWTSFRRRFAFRVPTAGPVIVSDKLFHLLGSDHLPRFGQRLAVETRGDRIIFRPQAFPYIEAPRGIGHIGGNAPQIRRTEPKTGGRFDDR